MWRTYVFNKTITEKLNSLEEKEGKTNKNKTYKKSTKKSG
jgi:hypothetical protein